MAEANPTLTPERQWARQVIKEYREHKNPPPSTDIDLVWVLAGHFVYEPDLSPDFDNGFPQLYQTIFAQEEVERINLGIELVRQITAMRLNKNVSEVTKADIAKHGPIFLYNGRLDQNENLHKASQNPSFPIPPEKLRIEKIADDFDPKNNNTYTQFQRFPQDLLGNSRKIAVVSSLYHLPRIARHPNANTVVAAHPAWPDKEFVFFASDKPFDQLPHDEESITKRALDIRKMVMDEGRKIHTYIQKNDLSIDRPYNS